MNVDKQRKIYIVLSHNYTFFGNIVCLRQLLHFGFNDTGSKYSHVSLSLDSELHRMLSFARKKIHNPLIAGLVMEDISSGVFSLKPEKNYIAVICLKVTEDQYNKLFLRMKEYWNKKDNYKYDIVSLFRILFHGRDNRRCENKNAFCCSIWVEDILRECGIDLFKNLYTVTPVDFYHKLQPYIIYEGLTKEYSNHARAGNASHIL